MFPWSRSLITGASAGLGAEYARQLGAAGSELVLVARRADRLRDLAASVGGAEVLVADLATSDGRAVVADRLRSTTEPIDLLVNNAGIGTLGLYWELPYAEEQRELAVNVEAVMELTHAALTQMVAAGRGHVLNVSSIASNQHQPTGATYSATKAFVTSFSESLHASLRDTPVGVTAVLPGFVRTEFHEAAGIEDSLEGVPQRAFLDAADVVADSLRATAARKPISVPSRTYKALNAFATMMPRPVLRGVVRRLAGVRATD